MKILYVSAYFPPEMGAPAARVSELSRWWAQHGHEVTVLTAFPNHPTGEVPKEYRAHKRRLIMRETYEGVTVQRTWLAAFPNRKSWERILNYASFCVSAAIRGIFLPRPDVIIGTSPHLLAALAAFWIAWWKRVPFIFEVRDLWPEGLTATDIAKEKSLMVRAVAALVRILYRRAAQIVIVSPAFQGRLIDYWKVPPEKISIIMNGVDTKLFSPDGGTGTVIEDFGLQGKFVVSFIGTIGATHGLWTLVNAAKILQERLPQVQLLLVGEGAEKQRVEALASEAGVSNLKIAEQIPRQRVPDLIRACDINLVLLRKSELFTMVIPTKMLEFMACGRPVILGVEGQAKQILEDAQGGVCIPPEDHVALAEAIEQLYRDPDRRARLGQGGRHYIVSRMSRDQFAADYVGILEGVLPKSDSRERQQAGE